MQKEKRVMKFETISTKYEYCCDYCDVMTVNKYNDITTCEICGKHYCNDHGYWNYDGDYRVDKFCNNCYGIFINEAASEINELRNELLDIEDEFNNKIAEINERWKKKAIKNV